MNAAAQLGDWVGRSWQRKDVIDARLIAEFRATFAPHVPVSAAVPPGIHWCLCPDIVTPDLMGGDAHPRLGLFLPDLGLPRRMWAGGAFESDGDFELGDSVVRTSTITDISRKTGKSGDLCFVTVRHTYAARGKLRLSERQDIVYRGAPAAGAPPAGQIGTPVAPPTGSWTIEATPALLFRYSAMTFNSHRIHYDLPYATGVEGYAGLVVHGPLQASLMLNRATAELGRLPRRFSYRGQAPLICGARFHVSLAGSSVQVTSADGTATMVGEVD